MKIKILLKLHSIKISFDWLKAWKPLQKKIKGMRELNE